jgi:hypothetical protein
MLRDADLGWLETVLRPDAQQVDAAEEHHGGVAEAPRQARSQ